MTAPAPLWRTASIGLYERQKSRLIPLCLCLGVLVSGCAGAASPPAPAHVIIGMAMCPEPATPPLRALDGTRSFDSPVAWGIIMERDDVLRSYISALRRTVNCYAAQTVNPVD